VTGVQTCALPISQRHRVAFPPDVIVDRGGWRRRQSDVRAESLVKRTSSGWHQEPVGIRHCPARASFDRGPVGGRVRRLRDGRRLLGYLQPALGELLHCSGPSDGWRMRRKRGNGVVEQHYGDVASPPVAAAATAAAASFLPAAAGGPRNVRLQRVRLPSAGVPDDKLWITDAVVNRWRCWRRTSRVVEFGFSRRSRTAGVCWLVVTTGTAIAAGRDVSEDDAGLKAAAKRTSLLSCASRWVDSCQSTCENSAVDWSAVCSPCCLRIVSVRRPNRCGRVRADDQRAELGSSSVIEYTRSQCCGQR